MNIKTKQRTKYQKGELLIHTQTHTTEEAHTVNVDVVICIFCHCVIFTLLAFLNGRKRCCPLSSSSLSFLLSKSFDFY